MAARERNIIKVILVQTAKVYNALKTVDREAKGRRRAAPEIWASKGGADASSCSAEVPSVVHPPILTLLWFRVLAIG